MGGGKAAVMTLAIPIFQSRVRAQKLRARRLARRAPGRHFPAKINASPFIDRRVYPHRPRPVTTLAPTESFVAHPSISFNTPVSPSPFNLMAKSKSYGGLIVLALLVAAAGGGAWYYFNAKTDKAPEFQTTKVSRGDIVQTITATGDLQPVIS
eukprot:gene64718-88539_t